MKIRTRIITGVLCFFILLPSVLLSACGRSFEPAEGETFVYCLNEEHTGLVKVAFEFSGEDTMGIVESVLGKLQEPSDRIEYTAPIPENVEVTECGLRGSILGVDFNAAYEEMDGLSEKLTRAAVVRSLVQIDGVNAVAFTIEGEPLVDSEGHLVGLMNDDDFVENNESSLDDYQTDTLAVYFADKTGR